MDLAKLVQVRSALQDAADSAALSAASALAGKGILLVSSELPEVLSLAHRIVVLRRGCVSATLDAASTDQETVLRHAMPL